MSSPTPATVITNIGCLVTLAPLAKRWLGTLASDARRAPALNSPITAKDLGSETACWLAINDGGRVLSSGSGQAPQAASKVIDAQGGVVIPGLCDSHTHTLFGGSRAAEFCQRLDGVSYQDIANAGGGIQSTVKATRTSDDATLVALVQQRLRRQRRLGITTTEIKSGYGLTVAEERRSLEIIQQAAQADQGTTVATCLALHADSPEAPSRQHYIDEVCAELLPEVAERKLAAYVDAFIEQGYFSVADVEPYAQRAADLGLGLRLHADEFSDAGAAAAAASWGAASADHLQFASAAGRQAMAAAGTVATMLPGTSMFTGIPYTQGKDFVAAGCAVAIASDFNPGSAMTDNLMQLATLAAVNGGLPAATTLAGITLVPAASLGLGHRKGALAPGYDADLCLYHGVADWTELLWDCGRMEPALVLSAGQAVNEAGPCL